MGREPFTEHVFHLRLRAAYRPVFWFGVGTLTFGICAVVFPIFATFAATLFVGTLLLVAGAAMLAGALSIHATGPFFGALLFSLLMTGSGVFLLWNPLAGEAAITLTLGVIFLVEGAYEIAFALELRPHTGWVAMLVSAMASILLAAVIIAGWPGISVAVLGLLIGVNFITAGIGYIVAARALSPGT